MQKWLTHIHHHARYTCELDIQQHTLPSSPEKRGGKGGRMLKNCLNLLFWKGDKCGNSKLLGLWFREKMPSLSFWKNAVFQMSSCFVGRLFFFSCGNPPYGGLCQWPPRAAWPTQQRHIDFLESEQPPGEASKAGKLMIRDLNWLVVGCTKSLKNI